MVSIHDNRPAFNRLRLLWFSTFPHVKLLSNGFVYLAHASMSVELVSTIRKTTEGYGKVSGYKLEDNNCKSLRRGKYFSQGLKDSYKNKWDTSKLRYLGINSSENLGEVCENNFGASKIRKDPTSGGLKATKQSRIDRNGTFCFKHNQCQQQDHTWNKIITKCIWNHIRQRLNLKPYKCNPGV